MDKDLWKEGGVAEDHVSSVETKPSRTASQPDKETKEWKLIEKAVLSLTAEQKRSRRWGIFFKLLTFVYLFALLFVFGGKVEPDLKDKVADHTAVVKIKGVIADGEDASAKNIVEALRKAFENEHSKGVILEINSPGGSPVQAGYVYDEIRRLRALYPDKRAYAVIQDLGASGAYYIAAAADEIYADKASLVGSIGVTASGFGFVGTLEKLGIERRVYTAGEHKTFLDPFSPEKEEEVNFWKGVLGETHRQFIEQVRKGRGNRLSEAPNLFSGLVWNGERAVELGLVDGLGSVDHVARELVGQEKLVYYTLKPDAFEQFTRNFATTFGKTVATIFAESRYPGMR